MHRWVPWIAGFSAQFVDDAIRAFMPAKGGRRSLILAIRWRQPSRGLIHHSDQGGQYAGGEYRQVMARARMEQSMSRPDNCYDNAFLESCFGKLKTELPMEVYGDVRAAGEEIREYLGY